MNAEISPTRDTYRHGDLRRALLAVGISASGAPAGLTGYTVIAAASRDAVAALARDCPHLGTFGSTGVPGTVEIYEALQV